MTKIELPFDVLVIFHSINTKNPNLTIEMISNYFKEITKVERDMFDYLASNFMLHICMELLLN